MGSCTFKLSESCSELFNENICDGLTQPIRHCSTLDGTMCSWILCHWKVRLEVIWHDIADICVGAEDIFIYIRFMSLPEETAVKTINRRSPACGKCNIVLNMFLCCMVSLLQTTPPSSRPIQQPPLSTKEEVLRETGEFTCEIKSVVKEFVKYSTLWR